MTFTMVGLEDADDPDAELPFNTQFMASVPRVGERLWLGSPRDEYEVVGVLWRLREQSPGTLGDQANLVVRRITDGGETRA